MATLDDLPEEILAQIASYLDTEPLSTTRLRYEPHPEGFRQKERPLLHLSSCSQQMRRVVLPTLFRHTRLNFTYPFQRIQISLIERQLCEFERRMQGLDFYGGDVKPDLDEYFVDSILEQIDKFLAFVERERLEVSSLLIEVREALGKQEWKALLKDARFRDSGSMWQRLFSRIEPKRIVMLAPASELAWLAGCIEYGTHFFTSTRDASIIQTLELDRTTPMIVGSGPQQADFGLSTKASGGIYKLSPTSILHACRWSHIGLNEGSFLELYGQSAWYEHGEPHDIPSLLQFLFPRCCGQYTTAHTHRFFHVVATMSFVDSFSYTAIFPPSDHAFRTHSTYGIHPNHYVRKVNLQLAPHPDQLGAILGDDKRVGRAILTECWGHVQSTYLKLRTLMYQQSQDESWRLRTVVSEDNAIRSLRKDLKVTFSRFGHNVLPAPTGGWKLWGRTWRMGLDENKVVVFEVEG